MYVPRKSEVLSVAAVGSSAMAGKSCMYVAMHVRTAAMPTRLVEKRQVKCRPFYRLFSA